jgi:hypothetical protein
MRQGWSKRTEAEIAQLYESAVPIVAEWHNGAGGEVTLYADGMIEAEGGTPIHLLAYVLVEWHAYRRGRATATMPRRAA